MHPAAVLLNLVGLSIMYMAPLLGWYMLRSSRNRNSDLWFGAALVYALGATLFAFQAVIPARWSTTSSLITSWITLTIFARVLRDELGQVPRSWRLDVALSLAWALGCHTILTLGGPSLLQPLSLTGLALFEIHLLVLVRRLHARSHSRGLIVLGLGLGFIVLINCTRVAFFLVTGQPHGLMDYSPLSNLLLMTTFLCVLCYSMGYWGYLFEKEHRAKVEAAAEVARAIERHRVADEYSQQLQQLVQQRDRMLLVSSRFSALNALTVFNAGIVHEISQPLQGILTSVEMLAMELRAHGQQALARQADDVARMTLKISHVLDALRKLIRAAPPETVRVPLHELLGDSLPVIVSECRHREVELDLQLPAQDRPDAVLVNRVLMERVMLNLVSNAIESFDGVATVRPRLRIAIEPHQGDDGSLRVRLTVQDNGPGLIPPGGDPYTDPMHSTKPAGLGVGLEFVRAIVASWGGSVQIESERSGPQAGTRVTVQLQRLAD